MTNDNQKITGGVKTPEGKEVSKYNAVKHNILRQTITEYEEGIYETILQGLIDELRPSDSIEEILTERVAVCYLKLYRVTKAEKELLLERLRPAEIKRVLIKKGDGSLKMQVWGADEYEETVIRPAYISQVKTEDIEKILNIYSRYETTLENRLYKALHELERIKRIKKGENISAPIPIDISNIGSFSENTNKEQNL